MGSPKKHLGMVVEALDEPRVGQWHGVWSLDLAGFHPFVPLHHEGDERNLRKEGEYNIEIIMHVPSNFEF